MIYIDDVLAKTHLKIFKTLWKDFDMVQLEASHAPQRPLLGKDSHKIRGPPRT